MLNPACCILNSVRCLEGVETMALVIEELVRRYQDLAKRSSELRSYL